MNPRAPGRPPAALKMVPASVRVTLAQREILRQPGTSQKVRDFLEILGKTNK